ncbi:hypothetical protein [Acetobacter okinawensis]|uniref:Uncharacterized protein n=1 Tax=Acetobacter okinawensis TaxID=1076594 RepID=A0A252BUC4_9PROT|nr:hypothetical protein [Acetobacter okinawensis]OUJ12534.1 hypothetical protein HK26_02315 [Acetobacter okinawensis]
MIPRPFTCCCAVLAITSGFFLYTKKHQTTLLDQQISGIVLETEHVRAQTAMLRTEWALENQPERLTALVAKHAAYLQSMDPAQFVRMADLVQHLPDAPKDATPVAQSSATAVVAATNRPAPVAAPAAPVVAASTVQHTPAPVLEHERATVVADTAPAAPAHAAPARVVRPHPTVVAMESPVPAAPRTLLAPPPLPAPVALHDSPVAPRAAVATRRQPTVVADAPRPLPLHQSIQTASVDDTDTPARHAAPAALSHADAMAPRRLAQNSDDVTPVRHPLPVAAASWHPVRQHRTPMSQGYMEARATSGYTSGSLLSRGSDALPAPVPVTN